MKLKNVLLSGAAAVLVAALAVGGTVAYLQDDASDYNTMTLGNVEIEQNEYERVVEDGEYVTDTFDNQLSYVLQDFTQDKALLPIVGDPNGVPDGSGWATAGFDDVIVRMTQKDSYGSIKVFAGKNAQDKIVTVKNTGKNDAYVRTIVAVEVGSTDGELIGLNGRVGSATDPWILSILDEMVEIKTVDEATGEELISKYLICEFLYCGANDVERHVNGVLPAGDTTYPSLTQVYIKSVATNEDMEAIDGNGNGKLDILVVSQAVQVAGFEDAETALDAGFGDITTTNHPWAE